MQHCLVYKSCIRKCECTLYIVCVRACVRVCVHDLQLDKILVEK